MEEFEETKEYSFTFKNERKVTNNYGFTSYIPMRIFSYTIYMPIKIETYTKYVRKYYKTNTDYLAYPIIVGFGLQWNDGITESWNSNVLVTTYDDFYYPYSKAPLSFDNLFT